MFVHERDCLFLDLLCFISLDARSRKSVDKYDRNEENTENTVKPVIAYLQHYHSVVQNRQEHEPEGRAEHRTAAAAERASSYYTCDHELHRRARVVGGDRPLKPGGGETAGKRRHKSGKTEHYKTHFLDVYTGELRRVRVAADEVELTKPPDIAQRKICELWEMIDARGLDTEIELDGRISAENIRKYAAWAQVYVCGSTCMQRDDIPGSVAKLMALRDEMRKEWTR